jgi:small subunit ribosomal protein S6e
MAKFKVIVSDPETGKSTVVELEGSRAVPLVGRRLGETIDGSVVGQGGHKLRITGGCDKDGFPMRPDIHGGVRTSTILSGGIGFHPKREGERRRKTIRGNVITEEIAQINLTTTERPQKTEKTEKKEVQKGAAQTGKVKSLQGQKPEE